MTAGLPVEQHIHNLTCGSVFRSCARAVRHVDLTWTVSQTMIELRFARHKNITEARSTEIGCWWINPATKDFLRRCAGGTSAGEARPLRWRRPPTWRSGATSAAPADRRAGGAKA